MKSYWRKISTEVIFKHPRLTLVEDEVELPNGKGTQYLRFEGLGDYVTVVAQQDGKVLLIKEYSYPLDEWLWQFPEGDIEASEDPVAAARRELAEEAGLHAATAAQIGFNYGHHRRTSQKGYVVEVTNTTEGAVATGDEEEQGIKTEWFTVEQINDMVAKGEIRQKNALAAWATFLARTDRI